jgi:outer membrane protein assembly factor BamD
VRPRFLDLPARTILVAALIAVLGAGCSGHREKDDAKSGPEVIYQRAQKSMKNGDFGAAIKQLEGLQSRFPFSESARQAQLDLIYAYYKNRETDPAIDAADTFIRENPTNLRVDYAYYMKGLINFERQANFMERWFGADLSKRPPTNARKSFDAFVALLQKYPHSQYAQDARQRMIFLRNRLADFEYHVAEYYMRRGAYVGAINRAKYCIENFDGAPAVQPSLQVLIDAYRKLDMNDLAANAEKVYDGNYPADAKLAAAPKKPWWKVF